MTKQVQRRRGTASQHTSFTGADGELSVNTTNKSVHVHDGVTTGGIEAARADLTNVSDASLNTALAGNTLSSLTITSADINGGTIDGTTIGSASPAAITGTAITGTSFVSSGNMSFADNGKAVFGAGSDLQIYHDGSNSYIDDGGVGNLYVKSNVFRVYNAAGDEISANFVQNGAVTLYHDNAAKLATTSTGVDVTGTITSDGLNVGGDGLFDSDTAKVEIKSFNPRLTFTDDSAVGAAADNFIIQSVSGQSLGDYEFVMNNDQTSSADVTVAKFYGNGDVSFFEDLGVTPKFFWDASAESLGIGTSSPAYTLDISGGPHVYYDAGNSLGVFSASAGNDVNILARASQNLRLSAGGSERLRITSTGSVGIGTSSPASQLSVLKNQTADTAIEVSNLGTVGATTTASFILSEAAGSPAGWFRRYRDGTARTNIGYKSNLTISSDIDTTPVERMRIDSSGNVLVGTTTSPSGSGQIVANGGVYLGGTTSANLLDDYEEGSFTPVVADAASGGNAATASRAYGYYTKIGRVVTLNIELTNIDTTGLTAGNDLHITGLPFTSDSVTGAVRWLGSMQQNYISIGAGTPYMVPTIYESSTSIVIAEFGDNNSGDQVIVSQLTSGTADINITIFYQAG